LALCYTPGTGQQRTEANSPSGSCSSSEPEVRRALRRVLPAHLMPSVLRRIDRFPMTLNGKVDLNLLTDAVAAPRLGAAKERGA
jgi:acyl-coenzyme A synthetase/AMP-(fatty) acid ligase